MKRRIYTLAIVLLITMFAISPVYAGGVSIKIGLGSITADLTAWGVGNDPIAEIYATGIPYVWCTNKGNPDNIVPGQNPSLVSAQDGEKMIEVRNGKFNAFLKGDPTFEHEDGTPWTATDFGCPNNNWTGTPYFVQWTSLTVTITNSKGEWFKQNYNCTTTYIPNYTPGDNNTFNDGTISCTPAP